MNTMSNQAKKEVHTSIKTNAKEKDREILEVKTAFKQQMQKLVEQTQIESQQQ